MILQHQKINIKFPYFHSPASISGTDAFSSLKYSPHAVVDNLIAKNSPGVVVHVSASVAQKTPPRKQNAAVAIRNHLSWICMILPHYSHTQTPPQHLAVSSHSPQVATGHKVHFEYRHQRIIAPSRCPSNTLRPTSGSYFN